MNGLEPKPNALAEPLKKEGGYPIRRGRSVTWGKAVCPSTFKESRLQSA